MIRRGDGVADATVSDMARRTRSHAVAAIGAASSSGAPFFHLRLEAVFPEDVHAAMQATMPSAANYRAMSGRARSARDADGRPTRTKLDLFPEHLRHLPPDQRGVWDAVGRALRSNEVREAFRERLLPALRGRFGEGSRSVRMYAVPILTRDVAGYSIGVHPDTRRKAMTVQLYLPRDRSIEHVGTVFHRKTGPRRYEEALRMPFAPNTGYAFAVGDDTYHSVPTVGPEVSTRDSILLTYFVDQSWFDAVHNRGKRVGNFVLGHARALLG